MKKLNNILLISGSGQNCGKTTLACHFLGQLSKNGKVYGLKITPHFHLTGNKQTLLADGEGYKIYKETDLLSEKDTSRMLDAGACDVYFLQCADASLITAYQHLSQFIPENSPVVCESGSLANVFKPGLHILVEGEKVDPLKTSWLSNLDKADKIIGQREFSVANMNFDVQFQNSKWILNKITNDQLRRRA